MDWEKIDLEWKKKEIDLKVIGSLWRVSDAFSVNDAAALMAGYDPHKLANWKRKPIEHGWMLGGSVISDASDDARERIATFRHAIVTAVNSGTLPTAANGTMIASNNLRAWIASHGIESAFAFPETSPIPKAPACSDADSATAKNARQEERADAGNDTPVKNEHKADEWNGERLWQEYQVLELQGVKAPTQKLVQLTGIEERKIRHLMKPYRDPKPKASASSVFDWRGPQQGKRPGNSR